MALETPTTKDINDAIIAQLEAALNQTIPLLPKSFMRVLSKTLAGVFILLYKYAGFQFLQIFVSTATIQPTTINGRVIKPLVEWGRLIGVGDPAAATHAELDITITVVNQVGILPSGTQLVGTTNGVTYIMIGAVNLDAPTVEALVRAVSDQAGGGGGGAVGNLDPGATMSFANPSANVNRTAVVAVQQVTGADAEAESAYRQRVKDRFQKRPQGGAYADYELWAEEPAGILNAYPYTSDCPGHVDIYIEATVESSGDPDGIPTTAQLEEALAACEVDPVTGIADRRPAGALVNTFAITRVEFDVLVSGLVVDNLAQVQADITEGITQYFLEREPYLIGLSVPPRRDRVTSSAVEGLVEDIVSAAGGIFNSAVVTLIGSPVSLYALQIGEKAKVGTVTYL